MGVGKAGICKMSPLVRITARSMKFCNSRTFPGHGCRIKGAIASLEILEIRFDIRAPYL